MFQTELNHYLQSFGCEELTYVMRFITDLGYPKFLMIFLILLLFGVDLKKGFLLVLVLLWTAMGTFYLKHHFDLPRPFHVDSTLVLLDGSLPDETNFKFKERDAPSFWSTLPKDVIHATRQVKDLENGFPSGHTSVAIALWGCIALLFKKKWVQMGCFAMMILIPISRIYLGVHFLADVIGGLAVGFIVIAIFHYLILQPQKLSVYLKQKKYKLGKNKPSFILLVLPLLGFLLLPSNEYSLVAYILGFGVSFLLLSKQGLPCSEAPILKRVGRTLMALVIFFSFDYIIKKLITFLDLEQSVIAIFISTVIGAISLLWLGVTAGKKLNWFQSIPEFKSVDKV